MAKDQEPLQLQDVIVDNMRRIRRERGLLQEDVATAARWVGVMWSSVTVTQIESQSRLLSLDEFLLLPLILKCKIKDLLATDDSEQHIKLGFGTVLDAETVAGLVSAKGPQLRDDQVPMLPGLEEKLESRIKTAIERGGLEPTLLSYLKVREGARGEAERKAAQTLKTSAVDITAYALRLWGRSLTEERDTRAEEQAIEGKETRAVRGHITRALLQDIGDEEYNRQKATEFDNDKGPRVKLKPVSADERDLRNISIEDYEKDEAFKKKAKRPYERWMRFKILEALEKEGTAR
jgi:transcriptional regulator with XRE-family HTH domain